MFDRHQPSSEAHIFATPWAHSLRWLTILSLLILIGLVVLALAMGPTGNLAWVAVILVPAILVLAAVSFCTIRRYEVMPQMLLVNPRLGRFQAFGKQEPQAVVLRFRDRTVVVTPAEPQRMVEVLDQLIKS